MEGGGDWIYRVLQKELYNHNFEAPCIAVRNFKLAARGSFVNNVKFRPLYSLEITPKLITCRQG
jgi:hypothetical protein